MLRFCPNMGHNMQLIEFKFWQLHRPRRTKHGSQHDNGEINMCHSMHATNETCVTTCIHGKHVWWHA